MANNPLVQPKGAGLAVMVKSAGPSLIQGPWRGVLLFLIERTKRTEAICQKPTTVRRWDVPRAAVAVRAVHIARAGCPIHLGIAH